MSDLPYHVLDEILSTTARAWSLTYYRDYDVARRKYLISFTEPNMKYRVNCNIDDYYSEIYIRSIVNNLIRQIKNEREKDGRDITTGLKGRKHEHLKFKADWIRYVPPKFEQEFPIDKSVSQISEQKLQDSIHIEARKSLPKYGRY